MKKLMVCIGVLVMGVVAYALAASSDVQKDEAAITALEHRYTAAFNDKNVNDIMANYVAGESLFVFDVTPPRQHIGWADYKKDWEDLFAAFPGPILLEMTDLKITVVGPQAYGHNIQSGFFTRRDGSKLDLVVRVTDVYRKMNGRWLIVQEHVSVPVDVDTGKPDLSSKP